MVGFAARAGCGSVLILPGCCLSDSNRCVQMSQFNQCLTESEASKFDCAAVTA